MSGKNGFSEGKTDKNQGSHNQNSNEFIGETTIVFVFPYENYGYDCNF